MCGNLCFVRDEHWCIKSVVFKYMYLEYTLFTYWIAIKFYVVPLVKVATSHSHRPIFQKRFYCIFCFIYFQPRSLTFPSGCLFVIRKKNFILKLWNKSSGLGCHIIASRGVEFTQFTEGTSWRNCHWIYCYYRSIQFLNAIVFLFLLYGAIYFFASTAFFRAWKRMCNDCAKGYVKEGLLFSRWDIFC